MIVTTAGRTTDEMIRKAQKIASELKVPYIVRNKQSIATLQNIWNEHCIVVGKERLELYSVGEVAPFFFHPNSSMFRIKRIIGGEQDPFVDVCRLARGKRFLDCTLGIASDSIVASFITGRKGKVVGVEGNPILSYIVKQGLTAWDSGYPEINSALRRIKVKTSLSLDYLKSLEDNSFDCVYFDPMFEEHILESDGIRALSHIALYEDITQEMLNEAIRVAKERVVLKDHFRSNRFIKFGFHVIRRKTAKFHFGYIEIQ